MANKKAVFLDIDGTLIRAPKGPFPDDVDAIKEAREDGHKFFINTGRSFANVPQHIRSLDYFDGIICGAGSHVIIGGKTIYHKWIESEVLFEVCDFYAKRKNWCFLEGETNLFTINKMDFSLMLVDPILVKSKDDFKTKYKDELITKLSIAGSRDGQGSKRGVLSDEELEFLSRDFNVNVFDEYSEALIKGESKSKGIKIASDHFGLEQKDTVAMGDSMNDFDMVKYAGIGVAMGNACQQLKEIADFVTLNCGEGGVAHAIKKFVL
ncbi:MAG: HAD family hydrolase [Termitinemataceae bacterium]|nr:MAG: HAD family hydrolase [Termitinemataceae bacterium]